MDKNTQQRHDGKAVRSGRCSSLFSWYNNERAKIPASVLATVNRAPDSDDDDYRDDKYRK